MNKEKLIKILAAGLDVNQYSVLHLIAQGVDLGDVADSKVSGWKLLLSKKGYLSLEYSVTEQGHAFLADIEKNDVGVAKIPEPAVEAKNAPKVNFEEWVKGLHLKLQEEMVSLTGKKQKVIDKKYSFLPNAVDLGNKLSRVIKKYKLGSEYSTLIEKVLLEHIRKSHRARWEYVTLLEYYILKNESSRLMTDLESFEEDKQQLDIQTLNIDL